MEVSQIDIIQRQIDLLTAQRDELVFEQKNEINKKSYEYIQDILYRWCLEAIPDHHHVLLSDRIGYKCNTFSERNAVQETYFHDYPDKKVLMKKYSPCAIRNGLVKGPRPSFTTETYYSFEAKVTLKNRLDKVFDNGNFKVFICRENLKRPQREAIRETIQQFIETGEYVYYEF